ncbi:alkylated DNA repair [Orpheovirus IHUMI-LCC2]|uniref:Alkylated DNA repair dioxygenase AlkB n=1 Tax=Orpheovirus IHUMI-LCC2 TaxID=2023057 RepID=A0A2I2L3V6_9VIRU|nr:alkylated DNA repair [Orpheovirus IHUMI-LCC2]SNW62200.1 Alkylated DNA repair dioxygenase AlkB [Orpheovirus IHUMI-LCC2]
MEAMQNEMRFFKKLELSGATAYILPLKNAVVWYIPNYFSSVDNMVKIGGNEVNISHIKSTGNLMDYILKNLPLVQGEITIYGKKRLEPRLNYACGDVSTHNYSNKKMVVNPWDRCILDLKTFISLDTQLFYNSSLINYYRDGHDKIGEHSDKEIAEGMADAYKTVATYSLGTSRKFRFKGKKADEQGHFEKYELLVKDGDLLIMGPTCQDHYTHCIPEEAKVKSPRISITLRYLKSN